MARELPFHSMRGQGHQPAGCMLAAGLGFLLVALAGTLRRAFLGTQGWLHPLDIFIGPLGGTALLLAAVVGLTRPAAVPVRKAPPGEPWRAFPKRPAHLLDETGRRALRVFARAGWLALTAGGLVAWVLLLPARAGTFFLALGAAAATLATLVSMAHGFLLLARCRRFGSARLLLRRFPLFLGETMELRFRARRPLPTDGLLHVTLRCVEETWEPTRDAGGQSGSRDVCRALHEETRKLGWSDLEAGGREFTVRFVPPGRCPPTRLTRRMPTYWELLVRVDRPGWDYGAVFLLPVYARP